MPGRRDWRAVASGAAGSVLGLACATFLVPRAWSDGLVLPVFLLTTGGWWAALYLVRGAAVLAGLLAGAVALLAWGAVSVARYDAARDRAALGGLRPWFHTQQASPPAADEPAASAPR